LTWCHFQLPWTACHKCLESPQCMYRPPSLWCFLSSGVIFLPFIADRSMGARP
jgi:hypothetical protein